MQSTPYDPKAVANYFLDLADRADHPVTPMQLIKLVYIAHGWNLALQKEPLVDEPIEAWKFGPVIASLYHEFKAFGNAPVTEKATEFDFDKNEFVTAKLSPNESTRALLQRVWDVYSPLSGTQLSGLTHREGTPWDTVWNKLGKKRLRHAVIPDEMIAKHFLELAEKNARRRRAAEQPAATGP